MKIKHKVQRKLNPTFQAELKLCSLCGPTTWWQRVVCAGSGDGPWRWFSGAHLRGQRRGGRQRLWPPAGGAVLLPETRRWWAGCSAPAPEDPETPPISHPSGPGLREQHSATRWRPDALMPTPPLTPQMHLPGRCAPDNQRHGQSPDPAQTTRCHQVVRPQRLQSFSSAWKVGSSFLCTLCFIFI